MKHKVVLVINLAALALFIKNIEGISEVDFTNALDSAIATFIQQFRSPQGVSFMQIMTKIGNVVPLATITAIVLLIQLYRRKWHKALLLTIGTLGGVFWVEIVLKPLISRPRPLELLIEISTFSFPSGHATLSLIVFTLIIFEFKDAIKNLFLKSLFIATNITLILLIGMSRIYLGVHWFSDIVSGYALGIFWVSLLVLIYGTLNTPNTTHASGNSAVNSRTRNTHRRR